MDSVALIPTSGMRQTECHRVRRTETAIGGSARGGRAILSVIVVNFNTRHDTLACIGSALAHPPEKIEIILVDNGSVDGSAQAVRERYPSVVVDEAGENLGFAKGVNRGVAQSTGEYVLLLNPDTIVYEGSLKRLLVLRIGCAHGRHCPRSDSAVPERSLDRAGIAFFGSYVFHCFLIYAIVRRLSGFRWAKEDRKIGLVSIFVVGVVFSGFYTFPPLIAMGLGTVAVVVSSIC